MILQAFISILLTTLDLAAVIDKLPIWFIIIIGFVSYVLRPLIKDLSPTIKEWIQLMMSKQASSGDKTLRLRITELEEKLKDYEKINAEAINTINLWLAIQRQTLDADDPFLIEIEKITESWKR